MRGSHKRVWCSRQRRVPFGGDRRLEERRVKRWPARAVDARRWMTRPSQREISKQQGATEPVGLSSCSRCICGYRYERQPRYRHVRLVASMLWRGWAGNGPCGGRPGRPRQKMRWQAVCKWPYSGSSRMPVLGVKQLRGPQKPGAGAPTREKSGKRRQNPQDGGAADLG